MPTLCRSAQDPLRNNRELFFGLSSDTHANICIKMRKWVPCLKFYWFVIRESNYFLTYDSYSVIQTVDSSIRICISVIGRVWISCIHLRAVICDLIIFFVNFICNETLVESCWRICDRNQKFESMYPWIKSFLTMPQIRIIICDLAHSCITMQSCFIM